jgi:hypothetical protein
MEFAPELGIVDQFQLEIENLANLYIGTDYFTEIKKLFGNRKKYDIDNLVRGLWYAYVIIELPSRTGYTIVAYEGGWMNLEDMIAGKNWLLKNWSHESLFKGFNRKIGKDAKLTKLRDWYNVQSTYDFFATRGREWMERLHKDEKYLLEKENELSNAIRTVKRDWRQYRLLVCRYELIAQSEPTKFIKKNGSINITAIARYIRKTCGYKQNLITIRQALYRFREKNNKIQRK